MIERYVHWNEDIGEWQLKCVAYTGNNMRKQLDGGDSEKDNQVRLFEVCTFECVNFHTFLATCSLTRSLHRHYAA